MSSVIRTHSHDNIVVLNQFTESSDSTLLYKGKPIVGGGSTITISKESGNAIQEKADGIYVADLSSHVTKSLYSSDGIHGLRYYNSKLQYYYNNKWNEIATGTTVNVDKDIIISPTANNALTKLSNGYYVQNFLISKQANNALVKYSDGYYVPKIPVNNATLNDIDDAKDELNTTITENIQIINQKYTTLTEKVNEIAGSITKNDTHHFTGKNNNLTQIIDISTLYNETENVILDMEFMIVNKSSDDLLTIQVKENDVETLNTALNHKEVQKYKLTNTSYININAQGDYEIYLYVQYI